MESFEAIVPVLDHALETLAGPFDHARRRRSADGPGRCSRPSATSRATRWCSSCSGARPRSSPSRWPATSGCSRPPARPSAQPRRSATSRARFGGLIEYAFVQTKMFKDWRAGLMHAGIFWGFVLLTIGTANIVTGGLIQAIISIPLDGALWTAVSAMQNVVAVIVLVAILWAFERRLISKPRRLTFNRDALIILSMIGGVVADRAARPGLRGRPLRRGPGAFVANALGGAAVGPAARRRWRPRSSSSGGATSPWWPPSWSTSRSASTSTSRLRSRTSGIRKLAPRGELPAMDLEREDATFGLKSLQDLGWKDLLDGFTCTECGRCQAACPANATGKPLNPKAFIMGIREMSVEAEHGLDLIPNNPIVRDTYGLDDSTPSPEAHGGHDRRRRRSRTTRSGTA